MDECNTPSESDREKMNAIIELLKAKNGKAEWREVFGLLVGKYETTEVEFRSYLVALQVEGKIEFDESCMESGVECVEIRLL